MVISTVNINFNSLLLLTVDQMIFVNSLEPDQARQNVGPDLDPRCLTLKEFFVNFENKSADQAKKKQKKLPSMQRVKALLITRQ